MNTNRNTILILLFIASGFSLVNAKDIYSPYAFQTYPENVYWGDTHLHTNLSADAFNFGNRGIGPEEAYRFARGQVIHASNGMPVKLSRPLDFVVIADHAENAGVMRYLESADEDVVTDPLGKKWFQALKQSRAMEKKDPKKSVEIALNIFASSFTDGSYGGPGLQRSIWEESIRIAEIYNEPQEFTVLLGFEWSSSTSSSVSLHRVVVFQDGPEKVGQVTPFSQYDSEDPEKLWDYMEAYEEKTAGEVLAIPHNSNLSKGVMFALENVNGKPLYQEYAMRRSRWEPLVEVTQIKGDSETHPLLSPSDDFADFETLSISASDSARGVYASWINQMAEDNTGVRQKRYEYVRSALKIGLHQQVELGTNPFKFGFLGSTDSHTGLSAAEENNFFGKLSLVEPSADRMLGSWSGPLIENEPWPWSAAYLMSAAGYAAIWAEENTRESLFAAMKRKEVYASTGPRITVRFFGGWDYSANDAFRPDLARIGYDKGVPMGGDLTAAPKDKAPRFLIRAVKDPDGANLDRVQVIKGWHDASGDLHEKIYNVALSDGRTDQGVNTQRVGNTVDVPDASYTNTIGDPELAVVWKDPDFDPNELAFYYLRVLEIPTPRWTAYDAKYFQLKDIPEEVPMITQERAYTSPIWYTPADAGEPL